MTKAGRLKRCIRLLAERVRRDATDTEARAGLAKLLTKLEATK